MGTAGCIETIYMHDRLLYSLLFGLKVYIYKSVKNTGYYCLKTNTEFRNWVVVEL